MSKLNKKYTARVIFDRDETPVAVEIALEFFAGRSTRALNRMVVNTIPLLDAGDVYRVTREFLPVAGGLSISRHGDVYASPFVEVSLPVFGLTEVLACCELEQQVGDQFYARVPGSLWADCRWSSHAHGVHLHHLAEALPEFMGEAA